MTDISPASLKLMKKILRRKYIPEDNVPIKLDRNRLKYLVDIGLVEKFTLVPPGCEGYPRGLSAYRLSPEGEDSIYKHRKVEREARIALILSVIAILISLHCAFAPQRENSTNNATTSDKAAMINGNLGYL